MTTEYAYQFGKRWDARLPRFDIAWLVSRMHVSLTDEQVATDIRHRCERHGKLSDKLIAQAAAYAVECHQRNRDLYARVYRGY